MSLFQHFRKIAIALTLVLVLVTATACGGTTQATRDSLPAGNSTATYGQIEQGNTASGQDFGGWVVQTASGLVQDAYVRDENKLGVVITPQVRPDEVRPLARSLVQGFQRNFPNRDLQVLVYAPDKQLILTAQYNDRSKQIQYQ